MDWVLHRTLLWDAEIPEHLKRTCAATEALNPEFRVRMWHNEDVRTLLAERHPEYLDVYDGYERNIQRADFARYAILYCCGGMYLDLDMKAIKPIQPLLKAKVDDGYSCILAEETRLKPAFRAATRSYPIRQSLPIDDRAECEFRVSNYFLVAREGDETLKRILDLCVERAMHAVREDYDVIFTTGPDVVSTIIDERQGDDVFILSRREVDEYVVHLGAGDWKDEPKRPPPSLLKRLFGRR